MSTEATRIGEAELHAKLTELLREHRELIAQLRSGQDHFRLLARAVWRVQEEERRRLSHELHDGIGHNITALIHLIGEALNALPDEAGVEAARGGLARARDIAESTLQDTRSMSRLLRPQVLDDLGLEQALRWLARTFTETHGVLVHLAIQGDPGAIDSDRCTLVFRLAQEALSNTVRHAQARHAEIDLDCRGAYATLRVRDDGRGADAAQALASGGQGKSSGLGGMRDRVRLFGGSLQVESQPDAGFAIRAKFPLHDEGSAEP